MPLRVTRRKDTGTLQSVGTVRPAGAQEGIRIRQRAGTAKLAPDREEAAGIESRILRDAWHGKKVGTAAMMASA
jgi:hypothetical protein